MSNFERERERERGHEHTSRVRGRERRYYLSANVNEIVEYSTTFSAPEWLI